MKRLLLSVCVPALLLCPACDAEKSATSKADTAKADKQRGEPAVKDNAVEAGAANKGAGAEKAADGGAPTKPEPEPQPDKAADGLDPKLDNSGLDDTGKAIAKLFDASKTCAFDMNSQIGGCKPYDAFRKMQRGVSPMTKEFSGQRDLVVLTRLKSEHATVRAWAYNFSRGPYRDDPESRTAIEAAISAETDTVALLVGLRALRDHLGANPSLEPVFTKHAASSVKEVAETAQKALDKAAQ